MYWFEFSADWWVDGTWLPGTYLASREDDEVVLVTELCLAGPQEPA